MATSERRFYYLVTGANRGLGLGLVQEILNRSNTTVIAAVRNAETASEALRALFNENSDRLIIITIDSTKDDDASTAINQLKNKYGISHLDVVIANAGIVQNWAPASEMPSQVMRDHFNVNSIAVLLLYQATRTFLPPGGKFVAVSSRAGSIQNVAARPGSNIAYGTSKVALNYIVRKIYLENRDLVVFPVHPGWVQTDMGNLLAPAELPVKESAQGIISLIDNTDRERADQFFVYDGSTLPW